MHWLYLGISIAAEVIGTSALKVSDSFTRPLPTLVAVCSYALAFYLLSLTLTRIPLGVAYSIWCGLGIALVALIGVVAFGERLDLPAQLGIALIISGTAVLNFLSKTTSH